MVLLFLLSYLVVTALSQSFVQSVRRASFHPAFNSSSSVYGEALVPACEIGGTKSVVIDALSKTQTLQWGIGLLSSTQVPVACRSSMSMDYDASWQYAVTKIDWKSQVFLPAASQALVSLSWAFDPNFPRLAGAVSLFLRHLIPS
jgi:hypothetical protein